MKLSRKGKIVLAQIEAIVLTAYQDGEFYSIGLGHNDKKLKPGETITVAQAFKLLEEDLTSREQRVRQLLKKQPTQEQFDALVLLHYQSGNRYLPAIAHLLNYGETEAVKAIWNAFSYSKDGVPMVGLVKRRNRELAIFANGDYGDVEAPIKLWTQDPRKSPYEPYTLKDGDLA